MGSGSPSPIGGTRMIDEPMQAADAERHVIGAALSGFPDLDGLLERLDPGDFYLPLHEDIWAAISRVHRAGNRPDPVSVRLALSAADVKHDPTMLVDYMQAVPLTGLADYYATLVQNASGLRRIQTAGVKIQQLGSVDAELDEIREQARATVDEATQGRTVSKARTLADLLPSVIDQAQNGQTKVLSSPWDDLDRLIGGLAPGRLVVFGARPGVGKSVAGTNLALHMAHKHKHAVLLSSMEMGEQEVGQRLLAAHARADLGRLQAGTTDEDSWTRIADKTAEASALPITIDDTPAQSVIHVRRAARNVQRTRDDLALIVVDYLQLMAVSESRNRDRNRVGELTEISRGLKLLARETGACVVAMAQLSREATKHSDGRPKLTDLRESGSIENDADQVILMHIPDQDSPDLEFIVAKNRHGPMGQATVQRQYNYARLSPAQWHPTRSIA